MEGIIARDSERCYQVVVKPMLSPHPQKSVTRVAIKMHGPFSESEASIESLCIIGSLWTYRPSRKDYAFRWAPRLYVFCRGSGAGVIDFTGRPPGAIGRSDQVIIQHTHSGRFDVDTN
jgi:hypothetical protein